ncbi:MAG: hypothetical protein KC486_24215, partial [Myxococcales bacterium]|nr:hypothetical protein [Myxococcales bacterium]
MDTKSEKEPQLTFTKHDRKRTAVELEQIIPNTDLASMIKTLRDPDISLGDILQLDGPSVLTGSIDQIATDALAAALNSVWTPDLPAVAMGAVHIGSVHAHASRPLPLVPTIGALWFGVSTSVWICGAPSGRSGDLGFVLCAPDSYFAVTSGSSKVFIGGRRAARMLDFSIHGHHEANSTNSESAHGDSKDGDKSPAKQGTPSDAGNDTKGGASTRGSGTAKDARKDGDGKSPGDGKSEDQSAENRAKALNFGRKSLGKFLNAHGDVSSARAHARTQALVARARRVQASAMEIAASSGEADPREAAEAAFAAAQSAAEAEGAAAAATGAKIKRALLYTDTAMDALREVCSALSKIDPAAPPSVGTVFSLNYSVTVGGLPVPDLPLGKWLGKQLMGTKVAKSARDKWAATKLRLRSTGDRAKVRIREAVAPRLRMLAGHPVDVVTGAVLTDGVDATLRGGWNLALRRSYASSWADRAGPLGYGWSHSFDVAVWIEEAERILVHRTPDGREVMLELPQGLDLDGPRRERDLAGLVVLDPQHGLRIDGEPGGRWRITIADGDAYSNDGIREIELAPVAGDPQAAGRRAFARARRLHGPEGTLVDLDYDDRGRLLAVRQGPRRLGLRWERRAFADGLDDRVVALTLPDPDGPGDLVHTRYRYDDRGDLIAVVDALGNHLRLAYDAHRLVRETLPDGRAFTFAYDGPGALARCLRTAGPDGVFSRAFVYDPLRRRTVIESGDEAVTIVDADGYGRVRAVTDSLGARWRYAHDDLGRRTRERDPAGGETRYTYDALGCRAAAHLADGSTWSFEHDSQGRRVAAIDGAGGRWRWSYDPQGRLIEATDPTGCVTRRAFSPETRAVEFFVDDDRTARLELGPAGEVLRHQRPDGAATLYTYDRRGRCVAVTDPCGARRSFRYDRADRLIGVIEPDGARRVFNRDALGRPLTIDGDGVALRLTYAPCGGLASLDGDGSQHAGMRYRYDLEGRLLEICGGDDLRHTLRRDALGA